MINYYEILGLPNDAGALEIKAAFRRLAKQFHPDMNPEDNARFAHILKAYEVLSDPALKPAYDYRLNINAQEAPTASAGATTKTWRFDERELKRRQYYNEHIKKHAKKTEAYIKTTERRTNYNEFKYILFATPLAVALFLLIMYLANPRTQRSRSLSNATQTKKEPLQNGESPYDKYFGIPQYDTTDNRTLVVKNMTTHEIIICLTNKRGLVRSLYIGNDYSALIPQLPAGKLYIRYTSGTDFDRRWSGGRYRGAFLNNRQYFIKHMGFKLDSINELTLWPGLNEEFQLTDEKNFFNLQQTTDDKKN